MTESVLAKSARGSAYNIAVSAITIVLGFTRSVLLARLLSPEQFGVVALALFFATLLTPFTAFGIDSALLQHKDPSPRAFATHFSLRLLLAGAGLGLALLAVPVLLAAYPAVLAAVFVALMAINLFESSYSTPSVVLRRQLRFGPLALLNLVASLAMTIVAPLLAYLGAGLWSLVAEQATGRLVRWVGVWLVFKPWRPSLGIDRGEAKAELTFGSQFLASNFLGIMLDRFDDFWTGTALGTVWLGFYSKAYEFAQYPERVLSTPITSVFFSTYAAVQDKRRELSQAFFRSSSFLVRLGLLLGAGLLAAAPEMTEILLTRTWLPMVPIFRLMMFYMVLNPFYNNLSYLVLGVGKPGLLTRVRLAQAAAFVLAVVTFAALWGVYGVAMAANLMMLLGVGLLLAYSRQYVDFSLRRMFAWPVLAALAAGLVSLAALAWLPLLDIWPRAMIKTLLVGLVYSGVLYAGERRLINQYGLYFVRPILKQITGQKSG